MCIRDRLRDDHRGVGVVDLDDHMIRELTGRKAPFLQFRQYELGAGGYHEVLLVDPKPPARLVAVIGIEEGGQAVGNVLLVEADALSLIHIFSYQASAR